MRDALLSARRRPIFVLATLAALLLLGLAARIGWRREREGERVATSAPEVDTRAALPSRSSADHDGAAQDALGAADVRIDPERSAEDELMQAAERALTAQPERALELIETADRRFGTRQEHRRLLELEALVQLQRIGLSHARAASFYRTFPNSPYKRDVERLTGYHPRPSGHD